MDGGQKASNNQSTTNSDNDCCYSCCYCPEAAVLLPEAERFSSVM